MINRNIIRGITDRLIDEMIADPECEQITGDTFPMQDTEDVLIIIMKGDTARDFREQLIRRKLAKLPQEEVSGYKLASPSGRRRVRIGPTSGVR